MTHLLVLGDYKYGYTAHVMSGLDAALRTIRNSFREFPDPDFVNEPADHLMGLSFVAIQNYLMEVPLILRDYKGDPSVTNPPMKDLLRDHGDLVAGTTLRQMEAVWSLANYWKHRDEWDRDWTKQAATHNLSAATIAVLSQLGILAATDYPMLEGADRLGVEWWTTLTPLLEMASVWRTRALFACGVSLPPDPQPGRRTSG